MDALKLAKMEMKGCEDSWSEADRYPTLRVVMAYAAIAQAEAMERIAVHLGNIHQALITTDADGEPITIAYTLEHISGALFR